MDLFTEKSSLIPHYICKIILSLPKVLQTAESDIANNFFLWWKHKTTCLYTIISINSCAEDRWTGEHTYGWYGWNVLPMTAQDCSITNFENVSCSQTANQTVTNFCWIIFLANPLHQLSHFLNIIFLQYKLVNQNSRLCFFVVPRQLNNIIYISISVTYKMEKRKKQWYQIV